MQIVKRINLGIAAGEHSVQVPAGADFAGIVIGGGSLAAQMYPAAVFELEEGPPPPDVPWLYTLVVIGAYGVSSPADLEGKVLLGEVWAVVGTGYTDYLVYQ